LDSGDFFGPFKAEVILPLLKDYYWKHSIDSLDIIDDSINEVLLNDLRDEVARSQDKSMQTISQYSNLLEIPNFESDQINMLPSFRGFKLSALEETLENFKAIPDYLPFTGRDTVCKVIKRKFEMLPDIYPVDNCLIAKKVQRPRFRSPTIEFYTKFAANLNNRLEKLGKNQSSVLFDYNQVVF